MSLFKRSSLAVAVLAFYSLLVVGAVRAQQLDSAALAAHFTSLNPERFEAGFNLLAGSTNPLKTLLSSFRSKREAARNADNLRAFLADVQEDDARERITKLRLFLQAELNVVDSKLAWLNQYAQDNLLPEYLKNNVKTDASGAGIRMGPFGRTYRALLLGLNAVHLLVYNGIPGSRGKLTINHLSILDPLEIAKFKGLKPTPHNNSTGTDARRLSGESTKRKLATEQPLPSSVDWVAAGAVGPVVNQGSCGCCWTFAAVAVLESRLVISQQGNLTDLSEQQLTSCIQANGCAGGTPEEAWQYVQSSGITSNNVYPYTNGASHVSSSCNTPVVADAVVTTSGLASSKLSTRLQSEQEIMQVLATTGPVAIGIATPSCFSSYSSGVLLSSQCACYATGTTANTVVNQIDHAVTIVGYGTTSDGVQYWKIKNSWGVNWGMDGYILIERNAPVYMGMCGLLTQPDYPITTTLSAQCASKDPPSYCAGAEVQIQYTNLNTTTGEPLSECVQSFGGLYSTDDCSEPDSLPVWAWVLIAIAIFIALILALCLVRCLCCGRRQAASGSPPPKRKNAGHGQDAVKTSAPKNGPGSPADGEALDVATLNAV